MKTIFKYQLKIEDVQRITMPLGAEIILVQTQHDIPCIWVKLDTKNITKDKVLHIIGTGQHIPEETMHVGSFQQGPFVWHVFEEI